MGEPLTHEEATGDGALAESTSRLERALAVLEARLGRAPATPELVRELETAHQRHRDLESAAAAASKALGRAMTEVTRALQPDDDPQDELPLGPGLLDLARESVQGLVNHDEDEADGAGSAPPSDEEPTP